MTHCGTTHHEGCACHEARWQELLREMAEERDTWKKSFRQAQARADEAEAEVGNLRHALAQVLHDLDAERVARREAQRERDEARSVATDDALDLAMWIEWGRDAPDPEDVADDATYYGGWLTRRPYIPEGI